MMVSVDGYFEGTGHDLSWHNAGNDEFEQFAIEQLDETSELIFGRRTYEMMADFWSSDFAAKTDPGTAERMNKARKFVFSRSLKSADWENTELHNGDVTKVISKLKQEPGKDIAVLGSSNLCITLLNEGLLDELRIMVNPLALGKGTTLFSGLNEAVQLSLTASREFKSGNVLLTYTVKK